MVKSLVIEGEASESDEEIPSPILSPPTVTSAVEQTDLLPKSTSDELLSQIEQDIMNSFVQVISDSQQGAIEELSQAAEILLNTQNTIQKVDKTLQGALNTSRSINTRLNDILSLNFIPQLYFGPQLSTQTQEKR